MARYQIIKRPKGADSKWEFVAHGARYEADNAHEMVRLIRSHGTHIVKLLAVP